jgi:acyl dehydratase
VNAIPVNASWGTVTESGLEEAAALIGQPLRRDRMQWITTTSADAIRHFAWGIGDDNPLWLDESYAAASVVGGILAPPCILYAVDYTVVAPKLPGMQWIYAGTDWTWFDHVRLDDRFRVEARLVEQTEKSGRRFARWVLQTGEIRYHNQDGLLVGVALGSCARTPRGGRPDDGGAGPSDGPAYSADDIARIELEVLAERHRGAEPLFWEDVEVGAEVPALVKGPLSIVDIVAWYSATQGAQPYGGAHADGVRYRRRHEDYLMNERTGAKDAAGRGHLDAATGREVGMGGAYDVGPQRISWAQQMLTNWCGDHGFLHRLAVSVRLPNLVGDTTWWRATVGGLRRTGELCLVDLDLLAVNQRGERTATGTATVALPSRRHGPVRLPIVAPVPL